MLRVAFDDGSLWGVRGVSGRRVTMVTTSEVVAHARHRDVYWQASTSIQASRRWLLRAIARLDDPLLPAHLGRSVIYPLSSAYSAPSNTRECATSNIKYPDEDLKNKVKKGIDSPCKNDCFLCVQEADEILLALSPLLKTRNSFNGKILDALPCQTIDQTVWFKYASVAALHTNGPNIRYVGRIPNIEVERLYLLFCQKLGQGLDSKCTLSTTGKTGMEASLVRGRRLFSRGTVSTTPTTVP
ncbi:hypothetical protein J6590_013781 [Homalodisca vitripennis]|nr:hypothetical protein J6590_013781 [Homalodisca vitripennis]